ncbi:MAG TPA: HAD family hydrolase [Solimonas sp.]
MRVAVFDVCNTLFRENTTAGFVEFYCRSQNLSPRLFLVRAIRRRLSPLRLLLAVARRLGSADHARLLLIRMLSGQSQADLQAAASSYVEGLLREKKVPVVWALLDSERTASRLVLASASLCVVVRELAARLDAVPISSELDFSEGVCRGRLSSDATGKKHVLVESFLDANRGAEVFVCTDNLSDAALLRRADEGVAVIYPGRNGLREMGLHEGISYVSAE